MRISFLSKIAFAILLISPIAASSQSFKRICVMGSSSAYGFFPLPSIAYPQDSGWAGKIKKYYKDLNIIDTLYNLGSIGEDCYSGMPTSSTPVLGENLPDPTSNISKAVSLLPKPDVIIINYPSNNYERISNANIIQCLQTMKDSANAKGIRCYITTTQPRSSFDAAGKQKLKDLRDLILSTFGIWAIDFFTPITEEPSLNILPIYDLGDNIHINPAGHTVLANMVIAKNIFTTVLPVKLEYFNAKTINQSTFIRWATSSEINISKFLIERSSNGSSFEIITSVNVTGNSATEKAYQYTDLTINSSGFFYRLTTVNNNSSKQISPVIFVAAANKTFSIGNIYPSPSSNNINTQIAVSGKHMIDILVTDAAGKQMLRQNIWVDVLMQYHLDVSKFLSGNYFIRFSSNGQSETLAFSRQ